MIVLAAATASVVFMDAEPARAGGKRCGRAACTPTTSASGVCLLPPPRWQLKDHCRCMSWRLQEGMVLHSGQKTPGHPNFTHGPLFEVAEVPHYVLPGYEEPLGGWAQLPAVSWPWPCHICAAKHRHAVICCGANGELSCWLLLPAQGVASGRSLQMLFHALHWGCADL